MRFRILWSSGWVRNKREMGPGLISISPPKSKKRQVGTIYGGCLWDENGM